MANPGNQATAPGALHDTPVGKPNQAQFGNTAALFRNRAPSGGSQRTVRRDILGGSQPPWVPMTVTAEGAKWSRWISGRRSQDSASRL